MNDLEDRPRIIGLDELRSLSRRGFCKTAGVGVAVVALPACFGDSGSQHVGIGAVDDTDAGPGGPPGTGPDFATGGPPHNAQDMATSKPPPEGSPDLATQPQGPPDMAQPQPPPMGSCAGNPFSSGMKPAQFAMNTATYFNGQDAFICRDNGGLYALSSLCTHSGCTNKPSGGGFRCPCHGATFSLQGDATRAPAFTPLDHYMTCLDNSGNVAFDTNQTVSAATRLNA